MTSRCRSPATRWARRLLCAAVASIVVIAATSVPARADDEDRYRGRRLVDVLRELRNDGLDLIYSTAVVPEDLRIVTEPTASAPRAILNEILSPLGLKAESGPSGAIMIVPQTGGIRGRVVAREGRQPLAGATVRLFQTRRVATSNADGYFAIPKLPVGEYRATVTSIGFTEATVAGVEVSAGTDAELNVELEVDPEFVTQVVVTPGQHSVVREEIATTRTITEEDTVLIPTIGGDISRVVELLPGVTSANGSAAFNIRGSVARDASMVLDGLELYDPYHLYSFQSPFSAIDSNVVDTIDFFGGGFTADFGDRHGGFVDISTVAAGAPGRGGALELGTLNSRFSYWAPLSEGSGSWLVSGRAWYPEAVTGTTEIGHGENLDPRFGDLYFKSGLNFAGKHRLSTHLLLVYDELSFVEKDEEVNEEIEAETRNGYVWIRAQSAWSPSLVSETALSGGRIDRIRDGISEVDEPIVVDDDRTVDFLGLKHGSTWKASDSHALKAGAEVRWLSSKYRYANVNPAESDESSFVRLDPDGTSIGVYVAWRARAAPRVFTELGARWDRQSYVDDDQFGPRFNTIWRPSERSELRFALGRFFQSQRIHELQVEDGETEFAPAERSDQAELSFQHEFVTGLGLRFDAYYRKLDDLRPRYENLFEPIELFPETSEDRVRIAPDEATLQGVELLLRGNATRPLHWWVSYGLASAEDEIDGRDEPRSWDQRHTGKFLLGYRRGGVWSVSLIGNLHSGWPTTPVTAEFVTNEDGELEIEETAGERNSDRLPSLYRLDLKARRSFVMPRGKLWLTLEVVNLTDRDNACCIDEFLFDPRPDGSIKVTPKYDYWLGFTPIFSVLWEF